MRNGFRVKHVTAGQLMRSLQREPGTRQPASPLALSLVVGLVVASVTASLRGGLGFGAGFLGGLTVYLLGAYVSTLIAKYMRTRSESEHAAEESRVQRELRIENLRAQDEALSAYLDSTSQLLVDSDHDRVPPSSATNLAAVVRGRTLMLLRTLDGERKGHVITFLYSSGLIGTRREDSRLAPKVGLRGVLDLSGADLRSADLRALDLSGASLREVNLSSADLTQAHLRWADLSGTNLSHAALRETDLSDANLSMADLSFADLRDADLSDADLHGTDLSGADIRGAMIRGTGFGGATMPNGQLFEDWLEDRESQERPPDSL